MSRAVTSCQGVQPWQAFLVFGFLVCFTMGCVPSQDRNVEAEEPRISSCAKAEADAVVAATAWLADRIGQSSQWMTEGTDKRPAASAGEVTAQQPGSGSAASTTALPKLSASAQLLDEAAAAADEGQPTQLQMDARRRAVVALRRAEARLDHKDLLNRRLIHRIVLGGELAAADTALRHALLSRPQSWVLIKPRTFEWVLFFVPIGFFLFALLLSRTVGAAGQALPQALKAADEKDKAALDAQNKQNPGPAEVRVWSLVGLVLRDVMPKMYDVGIHRKAAEQREYAGWIHWYRDLTEKLLSFGLVVGFSMFLARGGGYAWDYISGNAWRLCLLPVDINIMLILIGFALIVDGFIQVSAMTDAPGISHTLDAVIVILAGIIVMLVEAIPGDVASVSFGLRKPEWLAPALAGVIALLFLVRWMVQHYTWKEWIGQDPGPK